MREEERRREKEIQDSQTGKDRRSVERKRERERGRAVERPVWMNHLCFLHSSSSSHSISLLRLNIYTSFHPACACQPVNIIQPSAGNTFQSSFMSKSIWAADSGHLRAIQTLVYWTSADSFTKFCKFIKFPSIIRGERESTTAEWWCVYSSSCHFLYRLVRPYVVNK